MPVPPEQSDEGMRASRRRPSTLKILQILFVLLATRLLRRDTPGGRRLLPRVAPAARIQVRYDALPDRDGGVPGPLRHEVKLRLASVGAHVEYVQVFSRSFQDWASSGCAPTCSAQVCGTQEQGFWRDRLERRPERAEV